MLRATYRAFFRSVPLMTVNEINSNKNMVVTSPKRLMTGLRREKRIKTRKLRMHRPRTIYDMGWRKPYTVKLTVAFTTERLHIRNGINFSSLGAIVI
jgi:hypothetical protein